MMRIPAQWHEFTEFVRRALHDAVDDIEPSEDGLEPIRARIPGWPGRRDRQAVRRRRPGARRGARHGRPGPEQNRSLPRRSGGGQIERRFYRPLVTLGPAQPDP